jgi:putative membrane protein
MIVRPRPSAFGLLFTLRGSIVPAIAPRVLVVVLLSSVLTGLHHQRPALPELTPVPFTLLGLALSIFLGFRNSACYDRWWEGRKQWGQVIAEARSLGRDLHALYPGDPALRHAAGHLVIAYAAALRARMRGEAEAGAGPWLTPAQSDAVQGRRNPPAFLLRELSALFASSHVGGGRSDILYGVIDSRITALSAAQVACERLQATPTPYAYSLLLHRTAWLFCLLLPFGLIGSLGLATPLFCAILAYAFFGLDALGDELEQPFAPGQNSLPLDAFVRTVEIDMLEALGVADVPQPLAPEGHVLR